MRENRKSGIDALGDIPWGSHLCQFYQNQQELIEITIPYLLKGLENKERCISYNPYCPDIEEVISTLRQHLPDFDKYLKRRQIEVISHRDIYPGEATINPEKLIDSWTDKINRAFSHKYEGIRIACNLGWLDKKDGGRNLLKYETTINRSISQHHMIVLCSYPASRCDIKDHLGLHNRHHYCIFKKQEGWFVIGRPTDKNVRADLQERTREMDCLQHIDRIIHVTHQPDTPLEKICQDIVNTIPSGWRYPEITAARIQLGKMEFKTANYRETPWKQTVDIVRFGEKSGSIEVNYLTEMPEADEGPFLKEERLLLNAIAAHMSTVAKLIPAENQSLPTEGYKTMKDLTPLQRQFIKSGFEGFEDADVIELVLGLALGPRKAKVLAKKCLEEFDTLGAFLNAPREKFQEIGITLPVIYYIKLLHEIPKKILQQKIVEQPLYTSSREIFEYLYYTMRDLSMEVFKVIYLNRRGQIIDTQDLFEGTTDGIPIEPRSILENALKRNSQALIFVHNHPSGDPSPSRRDKQLTRDLVFVGGILNVHVLDHIIIGNNKYYSFADEGFIRKYEDSFLDIRLKSVSDNWLSQSLYRSPV